MSFLSNNIFNKNENENENEKTARNIDVHGTQVSLNASFVY